MRSLPDNGPEEPIKNNILWLFLQYRMDIDIMYRILQNIRAMPSGKDKYRNIERAIKALDKEGWPIDKEVDNHGIVWYSAGLGFMEFVNAQFLKEVNSIVKKSKMRELRRFNEVLGIERRLSSQNKESETLIDLPMMLAKGEIPLKYVPYLLKPLEKEEKKY